MKQNYIQPEVKIEGNKLYIGAAPKLIVDLKTQKNFVHYEDENIPYKKQVRFSPDLLQGKRPQVFQTAVRYYYQDACDIAQGVRIAREYGKRANRTVVVKKVPDGRGRDK